MQTDMASKKRTCTRCGVYSDNHSPDPKGKNGLNGQCRPCSNRHNHIPENKAHRIWYLLERRAENRDGKNPSYANVKCLITKEEFMDWYVPALYAWRERNPDKRDSIDRIDNDGHYELSNMQILELAQNVRKKPRVNKNVYAPKGMAWCPDCNCYREAKYFSSSRGRHNGLSCYCTEHTNQRHQAWYKTAPKRKRKKGYRKNAAKRKDNGNSSKGV